MARWKGSTTQRGLGWRDHQQPGRQLLARWRPGDLCARCGQPMQHRWILRPDGTRTSAIDVDDFPGRMFGGPQVKRLSHRYCNRAAGARMGNARRGQSRAWRTSRAW